MMSGCDPKKVPVPKTPYLPATRSQNPSPSQQEGQQAVSSLREITRQVLEALFQVLPSNYVSQTTGPNYTLQYQALAEQIAKVQLALEEIGLQSDVDFTRPEYLWQMIGVFVQPDSSKSPQGIFEIDGDLTYRDFLRQMILLLLQGSKLTSLQKGMEILTDGLVTILEKVRYTGESYWGWDITDQHALEINILCSQLWGDGTRGATGTGFPEDPFQTYRNNVRILRALKPAHVLYDYRHLFLEALGAIQDTWSYEGVAWYYEDWRKFCCGRKEITSENGTTLASKIYFTDTSVSFASILPGAKITILSGPNAAPAKGGTDLYHQGVYTVAAVLRLLSETDTTGREYVTSPTGLSGTLTVSSGGVLEDPNQDFSYAVEGEILTISAGPNAGDYRLERILGLEGGPVGFVPQGIGATRVKVAPCILQTTYRMPQAASGQSYTVVVERLGVKVPFAVQGEDASSQFWL